ncbi:MAG: glycosyltransferase [Mycoplasmataceae bacterium]|nr:glycosyltransferase [Mycoplasmataceae bacterium]
MNKSIDFLILTHNSKDYIERLLNNIISLKDFNNQIHKIIILDDNSSDNTIELISNFFKNYKIQNYKLINLTKKYGVFYNRVFLLENSDSDYAFFIDDDDTIDNNIITKFNFISTYNYDLIFLKRLYCYKEKNVNLEEKHGINVQNSDFAKFMYNKQKNMYVTGSFIKHELIHKILKYIEKNQIVNISIFEDVLITYLLITLSTKKIILDCFYFYNKTNQNSILTTSNRNSEREIVIKLLDILLNMYDKLPIDIKNNIQNQNFFLLIKLFFLSKYICNMNNMKQLKNCDLIKNKYFKNDKLEKFIINPTDCKNWIILNSKFFRMLYFVIRIIYEKIFSKKS